MTDLDENLATIVAFYEAQGLHDEGGIGGLFAGDAPKMVLVETGRNGFWLTPADDAGDAAVLSQGQECPEDWEPTCLIDVETLNIYEPVHSLSWSPTPQYIPKPVELDDSPLYSLTWGDIREVLASDADDESKIEALVQGFRTVIVQAAAQTVAADNEALSTAFPPGPSGEPSLPPGDGDPGPHGALTPPWEAPSIESHPMPPAQTCEYLDSNVTCEELPVTVNLDGSLACERHRDR